MTLVREEVLGDGYGRDGEANEIHAQYDTQMVLSGQEPTEVDFNMRLGARSRPLSMRSAQDQSFGGKMRRALSHSLVLLFTFGILSSPSFAQDCPVNRNVRMTGMTIGKLAFSQAKNPVYDVSSEQRINQEVYCDFAWKADTGSFALTKAVAGAFKGLAVSGTSSLPLAKKNQFLLPTGGVSFDLTLSKPITVVLLGGRIVIPQSTTLHVTNDKPIHVVDSKVSGTLTFETNRLTWKKALVKPPFGFPQMILTTSSIGSVRFRIEAKNGDTRIADGTFETTSNLAQDRLSNSSDGQRAVVRKLSATRLAFHVTENRIELSTQGVAMDGAVVVKQGPTLPVPVFADGKLTAAELKTTLDVTAGSGSFERFDINKIHYVPTPTGGNAVHYTRDEIMLASALAIPTLSDDQITAIREGSESLQSTPYFNFFAALAPSDILDAIRELLKKLPSLGTPKTVRLENQLIVAETNLTAGSAPMERAVLRISPSIVDTILKLRMSISFLEPEASTLNHTNSDSLLTAMAKDAGSAAAPFSSGTEVEVDVPIDLPDVGPINVSAQGNIDGHASYTLSSNSVNLPVHIANGTVMVDPNGAHILANLGEP